MEGCTDISWNGYPDRSFLIFPLIYIPLYSFTSRDVATLHLSSSSILRCRACYFTGYFTPEPLTTKENLFGNCRVSIAPGSWLSDGIHKVPGVGQGHHLLFALPVGVHKSPWLSV